MRRQPGDPGYNPYTDKPIPPMPQFIDWFAGVREYTGWSLHRLPDDSIQMTAIGSDGERVNMGEPVKKVKATFPKPWEAPQDPERFYAGDKVCPHCRGAGQYSTDTGFDHALAVYDCPTCHGAGSL